MSDVNKTDSPPNTGAVADETTPNGLSPSGVLQKELSDLLLQSGSRIREMAKEQMANEIIEKRVKMARQAIDKVRTLKDEVAKIKPDQKYYATPDAKPTEMFSQAAVDKLKKANAEIEKIDASLAKAFADPCDYRPLEKMFGGKPQDADKKDD